MLHRANFFPVAAQPELDNAWKIELDHRLSNNLHVSYYSVEENLRSCKIRVAYEALFDKCLRYGHHLADALGKEIAPN
jgi:hypothetical protein